jgi:hypothetical protein
LPYGFRSIVDGDVIVWVDVVGTIEKGLLNDRRLLFGFERMKIGLGVAAEREEFVGLEGQVGIGKAKVLLLLRYE